MELSKGINVDAGVVQGFVYGGPFRNFEPGTRRLVGIKMAAEINHPHDISIPTEDFSVPDPDDLTNGIIDALTIMADGNDAYVGCMGGIGRTGLFMGVLSKALAEYNGEIGFDPVAYVRKHYKSHAIETKEQQVFVRTFNTKPIVDHLSSLNTPEIVYVPQGFFATLLGFFRRD